MSKRKTTEQFIAEARLIHGSKYDYSKVEYKTANDIHTTELRKIVSRLRELGHRIGSTWRTDKASDGREVRFKEYYLIAE